ncbi:hypothetical protein HPB51_005273 [Rhipicephalus microplus]|uniref:Uncharacterized protein n=1 Tax=Rhipicephalus microplus TaxID=6941 RepID=A0A9J6DFU5_RHIMP|nr:hypothetical protein HPB51_005273 [Rhipicephalus microplus]
MFKVYLLASGASECSPERRKALLLHSLGPEGQRIVNTLSVSQAAEKTEEEWTGATPDVQEYSKAYTDRRRAAKLTTVAVEDMVRVKKSSVSFKGDISFSKPRKVINQCGPASLILDDGKTWNAGKLCKLLGALATMAFSNILHGVNIRSITIPVTRRFSLQDGSQRPPRQVLPQ